MLKIPFDNDLTLPQEPLGTMGIFPWDEAGYTPKATITMVHNGQALRVCLKAAIQEGLTVLTNQDNGPVWEDNCLELFLQPYSDQPDYINFECNALGAMVIGLGDSRHDRKNMVEVLKPQMKVHTIITPAKGFEVHYTIPFTALAEIYQAEPPQTGDILRLNAYICGEATPIPHFGMLFPIDAPAPDFHRPEFFREVVLG